MYILELNCNKTQASGESKDLQPSVEGTTKEKTQGGAAHLGFSEIDPDIRGQGTLCYK